MPLVGLHLPPLLVVEHAHSERKVWLRPRDDTPQPKRMNGTARVTGSWVRHAFGPLLWSEPD
ncbi:MAG TPA: hypothetical protein VMK12_27625 [Anaeromyxobacteraceae bacterium]|nr:hypothetical protein [Anaeromyxobacteraceae bacterium]